MLLADKSDECHSEQNDVDLSNSGAPRKVDFPRSFDFAQDDGSQKVVKISYE